MKNPTYERVDVVGFHKEDDGVVIDVANVWF